MNCGVSDVNGLLRNIYAQRTTLHGGGGQSKAFLISKSFLGWISALKSESLCVRVSVTLSGDFPEECNQIENKLRILFINEGGADSVTDTQIGRNHPEY